MSCVDCGADITICDHAVQRLLDPERSFMAGRVEELQAEVERLTGALRKARGFAGIVDGKILGPLPDDTRWAIMDLAQILREDIDAALAE